MALGLNDRQLGRILADAALKVFESNRQSFPDFNTMGLEMAVIISERIQHVKKMPKDHSRYFQIEQQHSAKFGGVNLHKEKS